MARKVVSQKAPPLAHWEVQTLAVRSAPDRLDLALAVAASGALLAPSLCLALGVSAAWLPGSASVWRAAHLSSFDGLAPGPFAGVLATQTLIFVALVLLWRAVSTLAPASGWMLPEARGDAQARQLFDDSRPGALIYVARRQRTARILVDPEVEAALPAGAVARARHALVEGLRAGDERGAIERARVLLQPRR